MEGLSIIIFIIIGIVSSVMKQQNQNKSKGGIGRQQGQNKPKPVRAQMNIPEPLKPGRLVTEMRKSFMPTPAVSEKSEGAEAEDRTLTGSLNYVEQSQSSEGICNEHPEHRQVKRQAVSRTDFEPAAKVREASPAFEVTEDTLIRSIVMAEILGPPRAIKRNIR